MSGSLWGAGVCVCVCVVPSGLSRVGPAVGCRCVCVVPSGLSRARASAVRRDNPTLARGDWQCQSHAERQGIGAANEHSLFTSFVLKGTRLLFHTDTQSFLQWGSVFMLSVFMSPYRLHIIYKQDFIYLLAAILSKHQSSENRT